MQKSPKQIANEKMWRTVFSGNYPSRQKALLKAHANNPEFQDWLKSSGHGAGLSVGKTNKAPTVDKEAQKQREKKSLKAYGATKGTRMGSEDGSGEAIRDTIAPLTRDQHAKVQTAKRAAAVAGKLDTKEKRAEYLRKLAIKRPTAAEDFDDEGYDDLTDVLHYSLHIPRGTRKMDEKVEQLDHEAANWRRVSAMPKGSVTGGKDEVNKHLAYLKAVHDHRKKFGYDTKSVRDKIERINRSGIAEKLEQIDEVDYEKYLKALAVGAMTLASMGTSMGAKAYTDTDTTKSVAQLAKERPALAQRLKDIGATGQVPASDRRAAELQNQDRINQDQEMPASERRAKELEKMKKEEFNLQEEPKDQADVGEYDYEGDMAKSQLRSILANAKRLHDMLEENTNLPEWVQSKITLAQDYILTAASYMEGEMNEEVEQIDERNKLNKSRKNNIARQIAANAVIGSEVPYDMIHSPLRSGRKIMRNVTSARASQLYRKLPNPIKKEEVEQIDEASKNLRFDPEAALQTTAPVVNIWQKAQSGDPRAKAAWAKHVRRIQKVEPTGMTKQDIEDHMQSNFGEKTGADQAVQRAMEKELKYNPHYRMQEKTERALKLAVKGAQKLVNVNPQLNGIKDNSNNGR